MGPPPLYDLTELQRHANRLFGFSAQHTLDIAQALYEQHKLISYPRTDSRHLSQDVAGTLAADCADRRRAVPGTARAGDRRKRRWDAGSWMMRRSPITTRLFPTVTSPERVNLSPDEAKIYDLVCRRLLTCWHEDHVWSVTTVITAIVNGAVTDRYHSSGKAIQQVGWKVLDFQTDRKKASNRKAKAGDERQTKNSRLCRRG